MSTHRFYPTAKSEPGKKEKQKSKVEAPKQHAYVIPYREDENGKVSVLIGQKKVVCYQAQERIEQFKANQDTDLKSIKNWISHTTFTSCLDKRFGGLVFYAGGRPTCFGGRANKNETNKEAAARELLEETGVMRQINTTLKTALLKEITANLVSIHSSGNFKGEYYALDIDNCPLLQKYLTPQAIKEENQRIATDDADCRKSTLKQRIMGNFSQHVSEMQALQWIPLEDAPGYLNKNAHDLKTYQDVEKELIRAAHLLIDNLFDESNPDLFKKTRNYLTSKIPSEIVIDNVRASEKLKNVLLKPDAKAEPEQVAEAKEETKSESIAKDLPSESPLSEPKI